MCLANESHPVVEQTSPARVGSAVPAPQCPNPKYLTGGPISGKYVHQDEPVIPAPVSKPIETVSITEEEPEFQ